ncbi:MAG: universal stress protein [Chloroflexi bacterium]|nr:universal stress protein [Chloroflexota bacterium]MCI0575600.1 universal stress protein [Chloroflexota bacterium]MCI0645063.1 universal stress protein [Chloroflexota bacterium]MCI0731899.1 universal stress protein [Chloroflexota bacterium]
MRILIATGGAAHSDVAVRLGACVVRATHSQATLLTVIKHETERQQANAILLRAAVLMAPALTGAQKRVRVGRPAEEIVREATEVCYDLIVIGERPLHRLVRRLLGPTADYVIARMPCPVMIARNKTGPLRRFLVCEGGRDPSLLNRLTARLTPLLALAKELTVLHVMSQIATSPTAPGWLLTANAETLIARHTTEGEWLENDLEALQRLSACLQPKVRHGLVVPEILAEAKSGDYDLVVIGAHQGRGWDRFLLDDLAHQIVLQADRPVLVV